MTNSTLRWLINFFLPPEGLQMDLKRRSLLTTGVVGLGGGLLFRAHPLAGEAMNSPELIRPPGARAEHEFLAKCIRCGECMKVCPTNVIQISMLEGGLAGMWSPVLKTEKKYCEYSCTMCSQVCPTQAIQPLSLEQKQKVRIGLAHIDKGRCLPYAYSRPCVVCAKACPLPEKAIWLEESKVTNSRGMQIAVRLPHVDAEICIGCGVCQAKCTVSDQAAIRVTSVGETRNPKNRVLSGDQYGG
jgi:MauM/NapG family ferredoxin protein